MLNKILIPTDFSKNALNATRYALHLYESLQCEFYFLNVFQVDNYALDSMMVPESGEPAYEAAKAESQEGFNKLLDILDLHYNNIKHKYFTISEFNYLSEALKQTIAKKDIDLVVMGTQGASGTKGVIFGSNTVNTMEKVAECPVLAVPEEVHFSKLKEIVFPSDYKAAFKRRELSYLLEIAKAHESSVHVLYVSKSSELSEAQKDNKQLLDKILEPVSHSFHTLSEKNVARGLTSFVESRNSDMIAFINRKHFFFSSVFSKPLIKEIGYDSKVPILALH